MKIGIILTPGTRSKAYLQKIIDNQILINEIIFMNDKKKEAKFSREIIKKSMQYGFDISRSIKSVLLQNNLIFKEFNFVNINHPELVNFLKKSKTNIFIYTGGGILKKEILNSDHKFIHLHSGLVPQYRGSTCFYYSIINDDNCGVTAYFMDQKLDTGKVIFQKIFKKPDHKFIDEVFDSYIRSETLIELLKNRKFEKGPFVKQNPNEGETYFIIHPVLKHIAILSCINKTQKSKN